MKRGGEQNNNHFHANYFQVLLQKSSVDFENLENLAKADSHPQEPYFIL